MSNTVAGRTSNSNLMRLLLIPVLCVVLLAVLCWPAAKQDTSASAPLQTSEDAVQKASELPSTKTKRPEWPVATLSDVVAFDPFQPLNSLATVAPIEVQDNEPIDNINSNDDDALEKPKSVVALQAIYFDKRGAAAILDSRVVRVGDVLANGSKVVGIHAQGVTLDGFK
jgi:hypothetical protein